MRRHKAPPWLRRSLLALVTLLVVEYFVIPELVGASHELDLLDSLNLWWVIGATGLEAASLICYALLTRSLLGADAPTFSRQVRITLATTALSHVVPAGSAGSAALGYQLLTNEGVDGETAGFALATQAIGSAMVLNAILWLALLISIPLAGLHPVYVGIAVLGLVALLASAALIYTFTRGEKQAVRVVRAVGRHVPRVGSDHLEQLVHQIAASVSHLRNDRAQLRRSIAFAALNWGFDAASLWCFLAALGQYVNPIELFAAYGIANVLAVIPITPGGLGVIEASAASLIVSFGSPRAVAALAVLGWRLVNFWLPIPVGGAAYLSLRFPRGQAAEIGTDLPLGHPPTQPTGHSTGP